MSWRALATDNLMAYNGGSRNLVREGYIPRMSDVNRQDKLNTAGMTQNKCI